MSTEENNVALEAEKPGASNEFNPSMRWYFVFIYLVKAATAIGSVMSAIAIIFFIVSGGNLDSVESIIQVLFFAVGAVLLMKAVNRLERFDVKALRFLWTHFLLGLVLSAVPALLVGGLAVTGMLDGASEFWAIIAPSAIVFLPLNVLWYLNYSYFKKREHLMSDEGRELPKKAEFCRKCGGEIDGTGKCTGCGHQYFSPRRLARKIRIVPTVSASIAILCAVAAFSLNVKAQKLNAKVQEQNAHIVEAEALIRKKDSELRDLSRQAGDLGARLDEQSETISDLVEKSVFFDAFAAISTPAGEKFHTYDCHTIDLSSGFNITTIKMARYLGYEPCKVCHDSGWFEFYNSVDWDNS